MRYTFVVFAILAITASALADAVTLRSGGVLEGLVLREDQDKVVMVYENGIFNVDRKLVTSIKRDDSNTEFKLGIRPDGSLPPWSVCLKAIVSAPWATKINQVPAFVVDAGVLHHVPYRSFRIGEAFEVNVYGDPDAPIGIEMGVYGASAVSDDAQFRIRTAIADIVRDDALAAAIRTVNAAGQSREVKKWTVESTPPTAQDAFGGWWISVYKLDAVELSRTKPEEDAAITVAIPERVLRPAPEKSTADKTNQRPTPAPKTPSPQPTTQSPSDWSDSDWRFVSKRLEALSTAKSTTKKEQATESHTGRVYVRAYYRKDGTYVHAHTRRR